MLKCEKSVFQNQQNMYDVIDYDAIYTDQLKHPSTGDWLNKSWWGNWVAQ